MLGQHLGDSKDLVTLQAAHHTLVQPAAGDQADSETGACLHFQSSEGRVAVQAATAKTNFPSTERMKDQAGRSTTKAVAAMGSPRTGWSVLVAMWEMVVEGTVAGQPAYQDHKMMLLKKENVEIIYNVER